MIDLLYLRLFDYTVELEALTHRKLEGPTAELEHIMIRESKKKN